MLNIWFMQLEDLDVNQIVTLSSNMSLAAGKKNKQNSLSVTNLRCTVR